MAQSYFPISANVNPGEIKRVLRPPVEAAHQQARQGHQQRRGHRLVGELGLEEVELRARDRLLNVVVSSCQSLANLVIVAADRPWLVPRNCVNAGPKSELDRPCRYSSGSTSATRGDLRAHSKVPASQAAISCSTKQSSLEAKSSSTKQSSLMAQ